MTPLPARRSSPLLAPILALGLVLTAGACRKSESPPAGAPQAQAAFRIVRVDLGTAIGDDKRVTAPTDTFKPTDTIYASVASEGTAPSATLSARWTFEDGQLVDESSQTIAPSGPAATEFHIAKPDGWPAGKYQVQVSANGQQAVTREFTVTQ